MSVLPKVVIKINRTTETAHSGIIKMAWYVRCTMLFLTLSLSLFTLLSSLFFIKTSATNTHNKRLLRYTTTSRMYHLQPIRFARIHVVARNAVRCQSHLANILEQVQRNELTPEDAAKLLSSPDETLKNFANLDHHRSLRVGFPEAVFAQGKTADQVARILDDMALKQNEANESTAVEKSAILATRYEWLCIYVCSADCGKILTWISRKRVDSEMYKMLSKHTFRHGTIDYYESARIVSMKASQCNVLPSLPTTRVVVVTAGTTDIPVAEEAAVTLELTRGCHVDRIYDAGVAGLHRIIRALPMLTHSDVGCVIVCAGMDGALPSVVGGLVSVPVIAVPTSIGYGASFAGVSAMLTMMNSCSPGVGVVNIDNGFGAAAMAYKIVRRLQ